MYHSFVALLGLEVQGAPRSEVYMERVEPARTEGMGRTSPDLLHALDAKEVRRRRQGLKRTGIEKNIK
jgi:hypothetical protein